MISPLNKRSSRIPAIRRLSSRLLIVVIGISLSALPGCMELPLISRNGKSETATATEEQSPLTPRELLSARLVNPPSDPDAPPITVGKLIEMADRYLSCDCAGTRFVDSWKRTPEGYLLSTNSEAVRPLELVCAIEEETTHCFLTEIDRGPHVGSLEERFVPGSEFIRFIYENGVKCQREKPCP